MIEWVLAFVMVSMSASLFGLCVVIFCFYASRRHKYLLHIALMSASYLMFSGVITAQLIAGMFKATIPQTIVVVMIFLALALGLAGLVRMWMHRHNDRKLQR